MDPWALTREQAITMAQRLSKENQILKSQIDGGVAQAIRILNRKSIPPVKRCKRALDALTENQSGVREN